jgi:hypothetical protein
MLLLGFLLSLILFANQKILDDFLSYVLVSRFVF